MVAVLDIPSILALATALVGLFAGVWLSRWWNGVKARRRMKRLRRLGERGEKRARKLLVRHGFRIEAWQVSVQLEAVVDGASQRFPVRADGLVTRKGERFVVEIKGGFEAAKITNRTTRRQLLEYAAAFGASAVVLVDAARDQVHTVVFPALRG